MLATPFILALAALLQTGVIAPQAEVIGPKTICFAHSSFALNAGERVESEQIGAHGVSLRIQGPSGFYEITENEAMRMPARLGRKVHQSGDTSIFRSRSRPVSYAFIAPTTSSRSEPRMIAFISGEVLSGGANDALIYRRLTVADPSLTRCDHTYRYGFDAMLGGVR